MLPRKFWIISCVLSILIALIVAIEIKFSYDRMIASGQAQTQLLTKSFQERVVRIFDATEDSLGDLSSEISQDFQVSQEKEKQYHLLFRSKLTQLPFVSAFYVVNRRSLMIANSSEYPTRSMSLAERPHIRFHFENPESTVFIGEISKSAVNGKMFIPVTKKIFNSKGDFIGIIGAAISPDAFQGFIEDFDKTNAASVALLNKSGKILARLPKGQGLEGLDTLLSSPMHKMKEDVSGSFREASVITGENVFISYTWIKNRPLLVSSGLPESILFSPWVIGSLLKLLVLGIALSGIFGTGVFFHRQQSLQLQSLQSLKNSYLLLTNLLERSSDKMGMAYFECMSRILSDSLGVSQVMIGEVIGGSHGKIRTLAYISNGRFLPEVIYDLAHTPCEKVLLDENGSFENGLLQIFPKDPILVEMNLQSYSGVPLKNSQGTAIGVFAILDTKPMPEAANHRELLTVLAYRLGLELMRYQSARTVILKTTSTKPAA